MTDAPPSTTGPDADGGGTRRRREAIRRQVTDEGFVRIKDLAAAHAVSTMTIHRDLDELQSTGWLRKVRGGATAEPSASYHGDVRHRRQAMAAEKHALAEAAASLVGAGATVMIDESTTALELAGLLPARGPLTVITNFLAAVNALTGETGIDLIALGGAYYPAYDAFLGLRTSEAIRSLRADLLFMSTTAITNGQCYHQSQETVAVKRALMESADRRVLLADHTKFDKNGLFQLAPLTDFDLVIVDAGTPEAEVGALRARGVRLHVAGRDGLPSWPAPAER
ncbi:DeoR/GlpR family DNA-binding transcription regulator [Actinomadura logoneensis]|uniref:DeoR/GlpR family DNA-binding transcription regulator n=1 Tax=Actinomadura logoneensis TaxID=2293572 RepID=UPI001F165F84|nr:DeoR/GlpR family DNA-binding transcription regulator [Actinomadura logoneensis]